MNSRMLFLFPALSLLAVICHGQEAKPVAPAPPPPASEEKQEKPEETKPEEKPGEAAPAKIVAKPAIKQKYVVQSGDNLWKIAKAHEIEFRALLHENDLGNADALKVGDVLTLPVEVTSKNPPPPEAEKKAGSLVASTEGAAEKETAEESTDEGEWELYTIQSGDNPWKIAKTKGLDHQAIVKLNPGLDFTKLSVGQEIKIPKK